MLFVVISQWSAGWPTTLCDLTFSIWNLFARWFKQPIESAARANVQKFLVHQLASGASPQTVMRKLFALRRFYNFLLDEETITKDPTLGIPLPQARQKST